MNNYLFMYNFICIYELLNITQSKYVFLESKTVCIYISFILLDEEPLKTPNETAEPKNNILHGDYKFQVI